MNSLIEAGQIVAEHINSVIEMCNSRPINNQRRLFDTELGEVRKKAMTTIAKPTPERYAQLIQAIGWYITNVLRQFTLEIHRQVAKNEGQCFR